MIESGLVQFLQQVGPGASVLAYLDAGTGSLIFQWVVAGMLGAAFAIKLSWHRITDYFAHRQDANDVDA